MFKRKSSRQNLLLYLAETARFELAGDCSLTDFEGCEKPKIPVYLRISSYSFPCENRKNKGFLPIFLFAYLSSYKAFLQKWAP